MRASISSAGTPRPTGGRCAVGPAPSFTSTVSSPALPARRLGAAPLSVTLTDCFTASPALQRVGPGQRQRPHIGLEGGVGPVAVVLHLEGVALHAQVACRPGITSWVSARMSRNGWTGSTSVGERRLLDRAVDMLDLDRAPGHALERMQDDEAGAVGEEVGLSAWPSPVELEVAVGVGLRCWRRRRSPGPAALQHGVVGHARSRRAPCSIVEVADLGRVGAPVLVAHEEADRAQHLDAVELDVAQLAGVELDATAGRPSARVPATSGSSVPNSLIARESCSAMASPPSQITRFGLRIDQDGAVHVDRRARLARRGCDTSWACSSATTSAPPSWNVA